MTDPDDESAGTDGGDEAGDDWLHDDGSAGDDSGGTSEETPDDSGGDADDSGGDADGAWNPGDADIDGPFQGDGVSGGAADVVGNPGEFLTDDYWFEGERDVTTPAGTAFLWALSAAGLYAASFIFAAVGLRFVAPVEAQTYVDLLLNAVTFVPIPMVAYIAAGIGIEYYIWRKEGRIPETAIPMTLLVPVVLHVSLFFVEWVDTGYTQATLADLFAQNPVLAQLLLWPPVITGTIYAVIAYRTIVVDEEGAGESDSPLEFA